MPLRVLLFIFALLPPLPSYAEEEETSVPEAADDTTATDETTTADDDTTPPSSPPLQRFSPQVAAQRHASVLQHLKLYGRSQEAVQLVAGNTPFHGLYLAETMGKPQGGVLLLHDREQHGHWPSVTGPLREYLPQYGWATFAIELPSEPPGQLPPRPDYQAPADSENAEQTDENITPEEKTTNSQQEELANDAADSTGIAASGNPQPSPQASNSELSDNEPALPKLNGLPELPSAADSSGQPEDDTNESRQQYFQQQMIARINAAVNYLASRGQLNLVIIANGSSASWAVNFVLQQQQRLLSEDKEVRGNTLILIDPLQSRYNQIYLEQELKELEVPILDLITDLNTSTPYKNQQRAGLMRHKQRADYQQIKLSTPDLNNDQHHMLKRRVRGWLKTNAAGTELTSVGTR